MQVRKRPRTVHDTRWGLVELPGFLWRVIDTPEFQRLRFLQQVGMLRFVYPGATQDRFGHSLGTAHLAFQVLKGLARTQPDLGITRGEIYTVVLGALCHDLGHGPLSHAFDHFMRGVDPAWTHEKQGVTQLMHLIDTHGLKDVLEGEGVNLHMVCEIMLGCKDSAPKGWKWKGPPPGREFLYEIVSNAHSGVDVDKWDYINRDGRYLNITTAVDIDRLLRHCRVIATDKGRKLAWPISETANVMHLFLGRYDFHHRAYQHRVARVLERMCMDAMLLMGDMVVGHAPGGADVLLRDAHQHPSVYTKLTDWIIHMPLQGALSVPPAAARIFDCILTRRLWEVVGQVQLAPTCKVDPGEVAEELSTLSGVDVQHFIVDMSNINCGKGRYDPMKHVPFFEELQNADGSIVLRQVPKVLDYVRPVHFQRRVLRVYCKAEAHAVALREAFDAWGEGISASSIKRATNKTEGSTPVPDTPVVIDMGI